MQRIPTRETTIFYCATYNYEGDNHILLCNVYLRGRQPYFTVQRIPTRETTIFYCATYTYEGDNHILLCNVYLRGRQPYFTVQRIPTRETTIFYCATYTYEGDNHILLLTQGEEHLQLFTYLNQGNEMLYCLRHRVVRVKNGCYRVSPVLKNTL